MMNVEWKSEYNLGIPAIDRQHQKLFEYLSDLRNSMLEEAEQDGIKTALQNLIDYGIEHFSYEEAILQQADYPIFNDHQALHEVYNQRLYSFQEKLNNGEDVMATELIIFIKKWLLVHILKEDQAYFDYFKSINFSCPEMN